MARTDLHGCITATGTVVVIDVIRAFTTAAYAMAQGARQIIAVAEVEHALALRARFPGALTMGEVQARPIPEFDLTNSPAAMQTADVHGRTLIMRTSSGTQGLARSVHASALVAAAFVTASATLAFLRDRQPITFVATGVATGVTSSDDGDEDVALADYLEARLTADNAYVDAAPFVRRVHQCAGAQKFADPAQVAFDPRDVPLCAQLDRFDFTLVARRADDLLILETWRPASRISPLP